MAVRSAFFAVLLAPLTCGLVVVGCAERAAEHADAAPSSSARFGVDASVADAAIVDASTASDAAATSDASVDAAPAVDGKAMLHTYRRVLHIGDSMVGFKFGLTRALGARFEGDGAKFFSIPVTSAGIQSFEKNTDLDEAIKKTHPDLVLLTLGANNATSPQPQYLIPAIKRVVKKAFVGASPRRRCYWIGPPLWKPDTVGFIDVLAKSTEPCKFFDSSKLVLERMNDGIHPTNKGGEVWADAVYRYLVEEMERGE